MNKRQKKKLFNKKSGFRLVKLPHNYQTWIFQYYTGIGVVTYKRICTEKIPDREKDMRSINDFSGRYYTCIGTCPICGEENIYRNSNYCHKCGQALDWEEVNNNEL